MKIQAFSHSLSQGHNSFPWGCGFLDQLPHLDVWTNTWRRDLRGIIDLNENNHALLLVSNHYY
jgi:hypothetical protein